MVSHPESIAAILDLCKLPEFPKDEFKMATVENPSSFFFFFFVIRHSFTIEDLVSAPNLKLGCAVILRGCASDYK